MIRLKLTLPSFLKKGVFAKKSTRLLLDVVGSLLGFIFISLLLLLGRLSLGPINLDFLTPEIETALNAPQSGLSASIEHTQLAWRNWARPFEVELVNVHLKKDQKPNWLKIEHIGVSLRLYRLLGGEASLRQLRLYCPHILLEKDEKGEFTFGFGDSAPDQEFSFSEVASLLALGGSSPTLGKLNELSKIEIIDAHVLLKDEKEHLTWELPKTTFTLRRQLEGFRAEVTLHPKRGRGSLKMGLTHQLHTSRFDVYAEFEHISFKDLIEKDKFALCAPHEEITIPDDVLNFLQCWDIPLHGNIYMALHPATLHIISGTCNVDFGKGELDLSLAKLLPLPVTSGNVSFNLTPQRIDVKNASLLSNHTLFHFAGSLGSSASPLVLTNLIAPGQALELRGQIEDLSMDHLSALWPEEFAKNAREWLTQNLRKGTLTKAGFSLKGHGTEEGLKIEDLKGVLQGEGAEITYLQGLPPAQNVAAHATFDEKGFDIKILSGEVEQVKLKEGQVIISGLDNDKEALSLVIKAKGPVPDFLDIINHEPLKYASYGGIDPKKTKGDGDVDLRVDIPLIENLSFSDIQMMLKGGFKKVALERKITEGLAANLTEGNFLLNLTQDQMTIQGKGILNNLPSILTYNHYFKDSKPYDLQIQIDTIASFEDFSRLGFDYQQYAKGPTHTKVTYTLEKKEKSRLLVDLDTTPATLSFPPLDWQKKAGERGSLSFSLVFKDGQLVKMKDLKMAFPSYSLRGEVRFGHQKAWETISLSEFKGPHTHTQVTLHTPYKDTYEVSFKGQSVDMEKYLDYINKEENAINHPPTNVKLTADVNQLRLGAGKVFQNVKASAKLFLQGRDSTWKEVSLRAKAGHGTANKGEMAHISGGILFDIKPGPNNTQTLEVRANDAGQFLKNLSIYEEIRGGYITIKAHRKDHGPYMGIFKLKEFDANEVPLLARFAALLSPIGVVNLFSANKTLSMDRFDCNFEFSDDVVIVRKGIGKSISLGFTVEGKFDRKNRTYDLKGNIIPARFLNSILSNIPLIGSLINGGEGEGLFAIAYTVKGPFNAPNVFLNPLSALAPGFLRKLFQSLGGDD